MMSSHDSCDFVQNARKRRKNFLFKPSSNPRTIRTSTTSASASASSTNLRRRSRKILAVVSVAFMYIYYFSNEEAVQVGRFLQDGTGGGQVGLDMMQANDQQHANDERSKKKVCSHTPYVFIGDILSTMPPTVPRSARQVPSYIQLCKEFLERSEVTGFSTEGHYAQSRAGNTGIGEDDITTGVQEQVGGIVTEEMYNKGITEDTVPANKLPVGAITEEMYNQGITEDMPEQVPVGAITEEMYNQGITEEMPEQVPVVPITEEMHNQGITEDMPEQNGVTEEMRFLDEQDDEGKANGNNENSVSSTFRIVEDEALCEDWVAPHFSTLAIYASSLIAAVGKPLGLRYKHDCRKHIMKMHNDPNKHYDYTPVQALLPDNLISKIDAQKIGSEQIKTMCQRCISDLNKKIGLPEFMSSTTHQCIMMPDSDMAESLLANGNELPMTYILSSIIDRMRHIADDWMDCNPIKNEETTGAIIALDGRSTMMNYSVYDKVIPSGVTSIQIFASSSCGLDYVDAKTDCIEHGRRLKRYFKQTRPGTYVRYDVVGSTAASYTRMINARILVCPPGTIMCLLPALSKKAGKKAYIAEDPSEVETFQWFENHVLAERKALGFQEKGFDAVGETDYLDIISDVSLDMPLDAIGESGSDASNTTDTGLDHPTDGLGYTEWIANERAINDVEE